MTIVRVLLSQLNWQLPQQWLQKGCQTAQWYLVQFSPFHLSSDMLKQSGELNCSSRPLVQSFPRRIVGTKAAHFRQYLIRANFPSKSIVGMDASNEVAIGSSCVSLVLRLLLTRRQKSSLSRQERYLAQTGPGRAVKMWFVSRYQAAVIR